MIFPIFCQAEFIEPSTLRESIVVRKMYERMFPLARARALDFRPSMARLDYATPGTPSNRNAASAITCALATMSSISTYSSG